VGADAAGDGIDELLGAGGQHDDEVAGLSVPAEQPPSAGRDLLDERRPDPIGHGQEPPPLEPGDVGPGLGPQVLRHRVGRADPTEAQLANQAVGQPGAAQEPGGDHRPAEGHEARPRQQSAVEVEQGEGGLRTRWVPVIVLARR
jgi:hypothetical protein